MNLTQLRLQTLPQQDYAAAVARAVSWLGDRYLLAKPINAVRRPAALRAPGVVEFAEAGYFGSESRWRRAARQLALVPVPGRTGPQREHSPLR